MLHYCSFSYSLLIRILITVTVPHNTVDGSKGIGMVLKEWQILCYDGNCLFLRDADRFLQDNKCFQTIQNLFALLYFRMK